MSAEDVKALDATMTGETLTPSSDKYEDVRAMWNGAIDRRPAVIARCRGTADVVSAVSFARETGLDLTVRGGGHGFSGLAICNDGLLLDLSPMKAIAVDAERQRARVQPGVLGNELDAYTQEHGLATTLGTISHTGVAGLTLGGGMGWLMRKHGLASDNLLSAEVVLADGEAVRASGEANEDLFWALRGGGGQFGAVTEFEYALHPVGPTVFMSQYIFPLETGHRALLAARDLAADGDRNRDLFLVCLRLPPLPHFPPEVRGRHAFAIIGFSADPADGDSSWMGELESLNPVMVDASQRNYTDVQMMFDRDNPHGTMAYCKGAFVEELTDDALSTFVDQAQQLSGISLMYLQQMGGAVSDYADNDTAVQGRSADYVLNVITRWTDPEQAAGCRAWAKQAVAAFESYAQKKAPLNFEGDPVGLDKPIYGSTAERLAQVKAAVDPTGLFGVTPPLAS